MRLTKMLELQDFLEKVIAESVKDIDVRDETVRRIIYAIGRAEEGKSL